MPSRLNIINQAVLALGETPLQSLTEDTTVALVADTFYPDARTFVLQDVRPAFARKRAPLSATAVKPPGWTAYAYPLPADCLVVIEVGHELPGEPVQWSVEGNVVLSDRPLSWVMYVRNGDDLEALMTGAFVQCLVCILTNRFAFANIGDKVKAKDSLTEYDGWSALARTFEGLQGSSKESHSDQLRSVR